VHSHLFPDTILKALLERQGANLEANMPTPKMTQADFVASTAFHAALRVEKTRLIEERKTCDHNAWQGMTIHGRCCPSCGTFMIDFGD
jgi:hypothetical protein